MCLYETIAGNWLENRRLGRSFRCRLPEVRSIYAFRAISRMPAGGNARQCRRYREYRLKVVVGKGFGYLPPHAEGT
jgi:hypothetical protein